MDAWDLVIPTVLAVFTFGAGGILGALLFGRCGSDARARLAELDDRLRSVSSHNRLMEMIALNASDGLLLQNLDGKVEWFNPALSRMTGYLADDILGRNPLEFIVPPEDRPTPDFIRDYRYDIHSDALNELEIVKNVRKNGELFWNQLSFAVVENIDGGEPKVIVIARDVTEQIEREEAPKRAKADLQIRAETDALTSLPNRMKLDATLSELLREAGGDRGEVGIIHVDLDQFKEINDALGHAAGDTVLMHTAEILRRHACETDLACRFGGDEFLIICPGVTNTDVLETIARHILVDFEHPVISESGSITVSASIGIALSCPDCRNAQTLMRQADIALYEIKNSGRNNIMVFSRRLGEQVAQRNEISSALSYGMANNQLGVMLQPQLDIATDELIGFEALMRWHHPTRGLLAPGDFFAVAEQNGQMEGIDRIAVQSALDALRTLHDAGHDYLRMSINVSGYGLNQDDYIDRLKWEVEKRDLKPENVAIEVLETTLIEGRDNKAARSIEALSAAGFAVELDDFGSGYSGLVNLARLKIQGVKIDRALIMHLVNDRTSQTIVRSIFRLCDDLGLSVISEGVERPEQAAAIAAFGGHVIQGYGIARPMSLDQALTWLKTTKLKGLLLNADSLDTRQKA